MQIRSSVDRRQQAETQQQKNPAPSTAIDNQRLLQELQVHQIELEMQNEELQAAHKELEAQALLYTNLYDFAPIGYISLNQTGEIVQANLAAANILGSPRAKLMGKRFGAFVIEADRSAFNKFKNKLRSDNSQAWVELTLDVNGQAPIVLLEAKALDDHNECRAIIKDITQRKKNEQELQTSHELLEASQSIAKLGGWELDLLRNKLFWTAETYRIHDTSAKEFDLTMDTSIEFYLPESRKTLSRAIEDAISYGKNYDLELQAITAKDRLINVRTTCVVTLKRGRPIKLTGIYQDITQRKTTEGALVEANRQLTHTNTLLARFAHYDPLTLLPNRVLLADRLEHAMTLCQRQQQFLAVAYLDLDGFKEINDNHGHHIGDELLVAIAQRMKTVLRNGDTLARIGGDEFIAVLIELEAPQCCYPMLDRLLLAASEPVVVGELTLCVSVSIGVTIYPHDPANSDQLIRHADQAMYIAKQAGKNCSHMFDVANDTAIQTHHESLEDIRRAFDRGEFVLFYQPQINMKTGKVIGVEALIRWRHTELGLLLPSYFLPVIENHPLNLEIGLWVVKTAVAQISEWHAQGLDITISINISAQQLQDDSFIKNLTNILSIYPETTAKKLELEILETAALNDVSHISTLMHACNILGVNFSLDDFGTGYSSLTYLKRLPVKLLKIDQSFVTNIVEDSNDLAIIKGIISLADSFSLQVIAEGVETEAQGKLLISLGCYMAQGFGIAHPMPAAKLPMWIAHWQQRAHWVK